MLTEQQSLEMERLSKLAHWFALRARKRHPILRRLPYEDCYQQAQLGLAEAIRRHDPEKGKVSTYAKWLMNAAMESLAQQAGVVTVSSAVFRGRQGMLAETVQRGRQALYSPAVDVGPTLVGMASREPDAADMLDRRDQIEFAMKALPGRLQDIVRMRIWEGLGYREIGERLGLTRTRVAQLEAVALRRMRARLEVHDDA